ncbi:exostosin family [Musa troglodytarum]|uniref:Exostosin family n=1 Tax=Musa troglodytarum TaxID=320322 RepID=A0A9E7ECU4_9LILI|nr:exostosin family [Musa troglodytarum]
MDVIGIAKAVASRLGCCGGLAGGGWRTLVLLAVALATSAAALFASSSSSSTGRVSIWFSVPFPALSSYGDVGSNSSTSWPTLPLSHAPPPLARAPLPLGPSSSPVASAPPSPSPIASSVASEVKLRTFLRGLKTPLSSAPSPPPDTGGTATPSPTEPVNIPINEAATVSPPSSPTEISNAAEVKVPTSLRETDLQLIQAKREIADAPMISNDSDLYPPLFLNFSVFKRSYELMETILKVYVYEDGNRPLCHTPVLGGIYASEGWFMKLMQENQQFVVKDPEKAHLFYLPYSSLQLRTQLYVPDSHSLQPISLFLRDYVNSISAKYPFWNRTRGADHFLVACHDWAPYTTKLHNELREHTIKAVCNADASEGIFVPGRDVSLPETHIRTPKSPDSDVGGRPASERSILAFFAGQMHGRVRPILVGQWGGRDEDMRIYEALPAGIARKMSYVEHMRSSKYCVCPMGYEVNSPRIVEAIHYECVPVIIADNFVLPFQEVLDWSAFSVVVAEKDIPRLKEILLGIGEERYMTMQMNVKRLQKHFVWHGRPRKYDLFHMILHSIWFNRLNQIAVQ